jgi:hypothetical protein
MKIILVLIYCFNLISCATKNLWEKPTYTDTIKGYVLSDSEEKIVIYGEKYNYTLPAEDTIKSILTSNKSHYANPLFHTFEIDDNNTLTGQYYALDYSRQSELTEQTDYLSDESIQNSDKNEIGSILEYSQNSAALFETDQINNLTGEDNPLNHSKQYNSSAIVESKPSKAQDSLSTPNQPYLEGKITGYRHISNKKINPSAQLAVPYNLVVKDEPSALLLAGKILATPITVVIDAALVSLFIFSGGLTKY